MPRRQDRQDRRTLCKGSVGRLELFTVLLESEFFDGQMRRSKVRQHGREAVVTRWKLG
jgi:hypothetical protein